MPATMPSLSDLGDKRRQSNYSQAPLGMRQLSGSVRNLFCETSRACTRGPRLSLRGLSLQPWPVHKCRYVHQVALLIGRIMTDAIGQARGAHFCDIPQVLVDKIAGACLACSTPKEALQLMRVITLQFHELDVWSMSKLLTD